MVGGKLTEVDDSVIDDFIIKGSKWFTSNYSEVVEVMKIMVRDYETFLENSEILRVENMTKFSLESSTKTFKDIMSPIFDKPKQTKLKLPQLKKIGE